MAGSRFAISFSNSEEESDYNSQTASFCCPVRLAVPDVVCRTIHTESTKVGDPSKVGKDGVAVIVSDSDDDTSNSSW